MKLLKFYADWCGPCRTQGKLLEGFEDVVVQNVDVDSEEGELLTEQYNVKSCPTLILVDEHDTVLERFTGLTQLDEIKEALSRHEKD